MVDVLLGRVVLASTWRARHMYVVLLFWSSVELEVGQHHFELAKHGHQGLHL